MHLVLEPLLRLFASLISRGGEPRPGRDRFGQPMLLYPLRPGTSAFFLGCLVFSIYTLAVNLPLLRHNGLRAVHPLQLPFGLALGLLAVIMLSRTLTLEQKGLRIRSALGPNTFIRFEDMHHIELYQSRSAGKATLYLRSRPDPITHRDQTITLPEMTYNTVHLLRTLRERTPLPEQPRHKRHWYGG